MAALGPPPPGPDLAASWTELVAWCGQRRPALHQAAEDVKREGNDVLAERTALVRAVAAASAAAGVVVDERAGVGGMVVAAVKAEAEARHAVERLEEAAAEAEVVGREATALSERALVATELARLLVSSGFERWLVSGALDELVTGASDRLGDLSAGQYSLVLDDSGDLAVIDHANADERRPVRTLSGGETFQAALALALTLSERVLSLGGSGQSRLDAIFLDEGFGTLDSQSLDAVAAAIEALATEGRAVGVVTHVARAGRPPAGAVRGGQGADDLDGAAGGRLMRVSVDPWDPSYGTSVDTDPLADPTAHVNLAVERPLSAWAPITPPLHAARLDALAFVDGVRRVEARVWVEPDGEGDGGDAELAAGLCASWAAGVVRCEGDTSAVVATRVGRGLFTASPAARDLVTDHGVFTAHVIGRDVARRPVPGAAGSHDRQRARRRHRRRRPRSLGARPLGQLCGTVPPRVTRRCAAPHHQAAPARAARSPSPRRRPCPPAPRAC